MRPYPKHSQQSRARARAVAIAAQRQQQQPLLWLQLAAWSIGALSLYGALALH